eukprot:6189460-Pleurochrysis_carterae.AAC.3
MISPRARPRIPDRLRRVTAPRSLRTDASRVRRCDSRGCRRTWISRCIRCPTTAVRCSRNCERQRNQASAQARPQRINTRARSQRKWRSLCSRGGVCEELFVRTRLLKEAEIQRKGPAVKAENEGNRAVAGGRAQQCW